MKRHQVVGIGNAVVDVSAQADDSFLELMGIFRGVKGRSAQLVDASVLSCFMPR